MGVIRSSNFASHGQRPAFAVGASLWALALAAIALLFTALSDVTRLRVDVAQLSDHSSRLAEQAAEYFGQYRVEQCTFTMNFKAQIAGEMRVKFEDKHIAIPVDEKIQRPAQCAQERDQCRGHPAGSTTRRREPRGPVLRVCAGGACGE